IVFLVQRVGRLGTGATACERLDVLARRSLTSPAMRPVCAPLLVAVALWPRPALPQGEPAPSAPRLTTTVEGTVPDLTGRWLIVANVSLEGQQPQEQRKVAPIACGWG